MPPPPPGPSSPPPAIPSRTPPTSPSKRAASSSSASYGSPKSPRTAGANPTAQARSIFVPQPEEEDGFSSEDDGQVVDLRVGRPGGAGKVSSYGTSTSKLSPPLNLFLRPINAHASSSGLFGPPKTPPARTSRLQNVIDGLGSGGGRFAGSSSSVLQSGKEAAPGGKGMMKKEVERERTPPPPSSPVKTSVDIALVPREAGGLSEQQKAVKQMVLDGNSVFFTGSAGTGKSFLLREIIQDLQNSGSRVAITASTGIAAINIHGSTLHSWAGIGLGKEPAFNLAKKVLNEIFDSKGKRWVKKSGIPFKERDWQQTEVLIIDEVSMLDGALFDKLNEIGQTVRMNKRPFGGIQLVCVGDFFQLPPVPDRGCRATFAFQAKSWKDCIPSTVVLNHVFRQKDNRFVDILNQMRVGTLDAEAVADFSKLNRAIVWEDGIYSELYPVNKQVNEANQARLNDLRGKLFVYPSLDYAGAMENGKPINHDHARRVLDQSRAKESLQIKIGAVVMLLTNLGKPFKHLVNGSLGKVKCFESRESAARKGILEAPQPKSDPTDGPNSDDDERGVRGVVLSAPGVSSTGLIRGSEADLPKTFPVVKFIDGTELLFPPFNFEEQRWGKRKLFTEATRVQVPLVLAWALSVHKSQGQTLERVRVDLERTFECGQAYVAISRCVSMDALQILNFHPSKVRAHPDVLKWMEEVKVENV